MIYYYNHDIQAIRSSSETFRNIPFFKSHIRIQAIKISMEGYFSAKLKELTIETQSAVIEDDLYLNVKITSPPAPAIRPSVSIICVLDISGSMDTEATQPGKAESDGFSRLDLVKHSVNTIINSLSQNDALGIVTFSDQARVDLQISEMNEQNRKKASEVISLMKTEGSTNLWDGIRLGLQQTKSQKCQQRNTFVVVLSDGEPNVTPPNGQLAAATQYVKNNPLTASMSMFGYGYSLNTKLLSGLTEIGGGCFGYIPDCSMIGTIFVNFLSSALSSFSPKLQLRAKINNCQLKNFNGLTNNYANLGTIQYGVTRNCLLRFKGVPEDQNIGELSLFIEEDARQPICIKLTNKIIGNAESVKIQKLRINQIETLQFALNSAVLKNSQDMAKSHLENMKKTYSELTEESELLKMLIRDIQSENPQQGQVLIALSKQEYWNRWGVHYFPALKIAHQNEMCTNFKDPGLQLYGGQLFKTLQNTIDTVFIHLAPPVPSIQKFDQQGNQIAAVVDMSAYYDESGGCIHGQCKALLGNGSLKSVKQLRRGDAVMSNNGIKTIKCVVETKVFSQTEMILFAQGLVITKYHPIIKNGKWAFPINEGRVKRMYIESYYNFVLEEGSSMMINGIQCITLGHKIQEQVAQHAYFGTEMVISDLSKIEGWDQGYIVIESKCFKRDPISKQVVKIQVA